VGVESYQEGKYTYKQRSMETWWGRRTAKKGYYREARRDGETKVTEK